MFVGGLQWELMGLGFFLAAAVEKSSRARELQFFSYFSLFPFLVVPLLRATLVRWTLSIHVRGTCGNPHSIELSLCFLCGFLSSEVAN